MIWLSHFQASVLRETFTIKENSVKVSLDLGITESIVKLEQGKFIFPDMQSLALEDIESIISSKNVCFLVEDNIVKKIQLYSAKTKRFYKLYPTSINTPPTVEISGIRMHSVKDIEPYKDAMDKVNAIKLIKGRILDTCFGLGYTSIMASKFTDVYSFEVDENILDIAKHNPWSKYAFISDKIYLKNGDIEEEIREINEEFFDGIIHDPPSFKICSKLYTENFYKELFRVLNSKGRLYHYIGNPSGKYRGRNLEKGVVNRLRNVGFRVIRKIAKGVVVVK